MPKPCAYLLERFTKKGKRYRAILTHAGRCVAAGSWDRRADAEVALDRLVLHERLDLPLRRPKRSLKLGPASAKELQRLAHSRRKKRDATSRYHGVRLVPSGARQGAWTAAAHLVHLGTWKTERRAAIARDRYELHLGTDVELNFPEKSRKLGPATAVQLRHLARQEVKATHSSPYHGVYWNNERRLWVAWARIGKRATKLGYFADPEEAAHVVDRALRAHGEVNRLFNFPKEDELAASKPARRKAGARRRAGRSSQTTPSSRYPGVRRRRSGPLPWVATLRVPGRKPNRELFCGMWRSQTEAAIARDRAALYYLKHPKLTFGTVAKRRGAASATRLRAEARTHLRKTSRFRGVSWNSERNGWSAKFTHRRKPTWLGFFDDDEEAAARAYDRAAVKAHGARAQLNFHPTTGEELCGQRIDGDTGIVRRSGTIYEGAQTRGHASGSAHGGVGAAHIRVNGDVRVATSHAPRTSASRWVMAFARDPTGTNTVATTSRIVFSPVALRIRCS